MDKTISVHDRLKDNFNKWIRHELNDSEFAQKLTDDLPFVKLMQGISNNNEAEMGAFADWIGQIQRKNSWINYNSHSDRWYVGAMHPESLITSAELYELFKEKRKQNI